MDFRGLDTKGNSNISLDWLHTKLNEGDELTMRVKEIDSPTTPKILSETPKEDRNEQMLKSYYSLQKQLQEKGLI